MTVDAKKLLEGITPGPWNAETDRWSPPHFGVYAPGGDMVCSKVGNKANARLIAAAPQLAERVVELEDRLMCVCRWGELGMAMLEDDGPKVVPHLIDTDDNPGEFLRQAMIEARAALSSNGGGE